MRMIRHSATQAAIRITFWMEENERGKKGGQSQIMIQWMWKRTNEKQWQRERK